MKALAIFEIRKYFTINGSKRFRIKADNLITKKSRKVSD